MTELNASTTFLQRVPNTPPPTFGPFEPLFFKIFRIRLYFPLYSKQIDPVEGDRPAAVVVFPPHEEQTEYRNGNICATNKFHQ